jgi:hypothetical protein
MGRRVSIRDYSRPLPEGRLTRWSCAGIVVPGSQRSSVVTDNQALRQAGAVRPTRCNARDLRV